AASGCGARVTVAASRRTLSHLDELESEAIHIMREVAAERERPVLLFSGGKDSIVLLRLAEKAFRPARFPFPVMHVDTGHNFPEVIEFRDRRVAALRARRHPPRGVREPGARRAAGPGERVVAGSVKEPTARGGAAAQPARRATPTQLQTTTLLDAMEGQGFAGGRGGARRDEERARAK